MRYETLGLVFNKGASTSSKLATKSVQFGDGYNQLFSFGINNKSQNWSGAKTGDLKSIILPIETFLELHKGTVPFYWKDPTNKTKLYVCNNWSISQEDGNIWNISLELVQFTST